MKSLFVVLFTAVLVLSGGCSLQQVAMLKPERSPAADLTPRQLYEQKLYDHALEALLESDPATLDDPTSQKLLWRINDRLVTVQWYLQKSIVALMDGRKEAAREHVNKALELYPDHKASLVFKERLTKIKVKKKKKSAVQPAAVTQSGNHHTREDLNQAEYYFLTGKAYYKDGQLPLAKASWLHGLEIVSSHAPMRRSLAGLLANEGLQLYGQGDIAAAILKWEEALKITPDDLEIKGYLEKARKAREKVRSLQ